MSKRRKKEMHFIDMSGHINLKIVPGTPQEDELLEKELAEIQYIVEQRMQIYEDNLKKMIIEATSETLITTTENDAKYFIEKYNKKFSGRNQENIKNRLEQYKLYIREQDN